MFGGFFLHLISNCIAMFKYITCLLFLFSLSLKGQYLPFPIGTAKWKVDTYVNNDTYTFIDSISPDTILIDGYTYNKVIKVEIPCPPPIPSWWYGPSFAFYLRQDTMTGKSWINNGSGDKLLFDFSLNAGDTLISAYWVPYIILGAKDTIILGGKSRRRFNIFDPFTYLIEGIGTVGPYQSGGLRKPDGDVSGGGGAHLICFQENGQQLIFDSSSCGALSGCMDYPIFNAREDGQFSKPLLKRLSADRLQLSWEGKAEPGNLTFFSLEGIALSKPILCQAQCEFDLSALPTGLLLLRFETFNKGNLYFKYLHY